MIEFPECPLWSHPIFASPEFVEFIVDVVEGLVADGMGLMDAV